MHSCVRRWSTREDYTTRNKKPSTMAPNAGPKQQGGSNAQRRRAALLSQAREVYKIASRCATSLSTSAPVLSQTMNSALELASRRSWSRSFTCALALEREAAITYLQRSQKGIAHLETLLVDCYWLAVLLSAVFAAHRGQWDRALQLCDYFHLEAAPPPSKELSCQSARLAGMIQALQVPRDSVQPVPTGVAADLFIIPATLPREAMLSLTHLSHGASLDDMGRPVLPHAITRLPTTPTLAAFRRDYYTSSRACILLAPMAEWPCVPARGGHRKGWANLREGFLAAGGPEESARRAPCGSRLVRIEVSDKPGARCGEPMDVRFVSLASFVSGCMVPQGSRSIPNESDRGRAGSVCNGTNETSRGHDDSDNDDDDAQDATAAWPPIPFTFGKCEWWGLRAEDLRRVGFLAQYKLLEQIPDLETEMGAIPYVDELGRGFKVRRNVWVGAAGATTALHFDPSDNLLCQVAGFKYVRLYAAALTPSIPQETNEHRRSSGNDQLQSAGNFSLADVEDPQLQRKHPRLAGAPYTEAILGPGEMLYIPWGHWHYCRSLTASISINVWWNRDATALRSVPHFGPLLERMGRLAHFVESKRL